MNFINSLAFARELDRKDPLKDYRKLFYIPRVSISGQAGRPTAESEAIYFCGNSLGLQPKSVVKHLKVELEDWKNLGVEGHLHAKNPWLYYHHFFSESIAKLLGAKNKEVVVMSSLTLNLNLMLVSFYRPKGKRKKILIESNAFPSDYYAIEQQIKFHGLSPDKCIIEVLPRNGEVLLRTEDIISKIEEHKDEIALVMFSAVNYYTGQFFEIEKISKACGKDRIIFGLDLAHAIGNVELKLDDWNIDFATWCSYKYLNSGPGGVSGIFVNECYAKNFSLPRFAGWWGNNERTRFKMPKRFIPQSGAAGWQISNAPVLSMAAHKASLEIFDKAGMAALRKKSKLLTGFLEFLLAAQPDRYAGTLFNLITPSNPEERGSQLSIRTRGKGKKLFEKITKAGIMVDWRELDHGEAKTGIIRVAPVPLYNRFEEVYRFAQFLAKFDTGMKI